MMEVEKMFCSWENRNSIEFICPHFFRGDSHAICEDRIKILRDQKPVNLRLSYAP